MRVVETWVGGAPCAPVSAQGTQHALLLSSRDVPLHQPVEDPTPAVRGPCALDEGTSPRAVRAALTSA
ncbi:hypothetical protein MOTC310_24155 [Methylobacterium oryzae]|uniref:Uncharacterized protein n=1 Tax=Methylobacterium oryzae TaxID=334852 RepID=A0ABU7TTZ6_9HYPH